MEPKKFKKDEIIKKKKRNFRKKNLLVCFRKHTAYWITKNYISKNYILIQTRMNTQCLRNDNDINITNGYIHYTSNLFEYNLIVSTQDI